MVTSSDDDVNRVIKTILDAEGKIDVVVNNAGVSGIGVAKSFIRIGGLPGGTLPRWMTV